jgi:prephenate dehydrogenase
MLACAKERGAVDQGTQSLDVAVSGSDLVVFAVPVGKIPSLMVQCLPYLSPHTLLTDMGSTKQRIVQEGARLFGTQFVGGHPMAGSEESGAQAGRADLFQGAAWIFTPHTPDTDLSPFTNLVERLGARPSILEAEAHDRLIALVSHLPHVLSFAFAATVKATTAPTIAANLSGNSYRDMTRVAASSPSLWSGILQENRVALLETIAHFEEALKLLKADLQGENREELQNHLTAYHLPHTPKREK